MASSACRSEYTCTSSCGATSSSNSEIAGEQGLLSSSSTTPELPSLDSHDSSSSTSSGAYRPNNEIGSEIWEVCCSSRSRLTTAVLAAGGQGRRLTLPDWDLEENESGARAKALLRRVRPKHVWLSIPCTAVSRMQQLGKKSKAWKRRLRQKLRSTRKMQRNALRIMRQQARQGGMFYYEWPAHSRGWRMRSLRSFDRWAQRKGIPLFSIRIDGCMYGLRSLSGATLLQKPWKIWTNDSRLEALASVCNRQHRAQYLHAPIQGSRQTEATSYYPERLVAALIQHWGLR